MMFPLCLWGRSMGGGGEWGAGSMLGPGAPGTVRSRFEAPGAHSHPCVPVPLVTTAASPGVSEVSDRRQTWDRPQVESLCALSGWVRGSQDRCSAPNTDSWSLAYVSL